MLQQLESLAGQTGTILDVSPFYGRDDIQVVIFDDGRFAAIQAHFTGKYGMCTGYPIVETRTMTKPQLDDLFGQYSPDQQLELFAQYIPGLQKLPEFKAVKTAENILEQVLNGPVPIDEDLAIVQIKGQE